MTVVYSTVMMEVTEVTESLRANKWPEIVQLPICVSTAHVKAHLFRMASGFFPWSENTLVLRVVMYTLLVKKCFPVNRLVRPGVLEQGKQ